MDPVLSTYRAKCQNLMASLVIWVSIFLYSGFASGNTKDKFEFFDAHVHLNDLEQQIVLMNQYGITKVVAFWGYNSDNQDILRAASNYPGRIYPFLSVSPERAVPRPYPYRYWWETNDPRLKHYVDEQLKSGQYYGIGELSIVHFPSRGFPENEYSPAHPQMKTIMRLARKYRVPVNIHCEITYVKELENLLAKFRSVPVIWAHGGYAPYYITKEMIRDHPNLVIELSMRTFDGHFRSPDYTILKNGLDVWPKWLRLIEQNRHRFIVGSDASHRSVASDEKKLRSVNLLLRQLTPATRACVADLNLSDLVAKRPLRCDAQAKDHH